MTDRKPGAPGQYKAVITASERTKMQNGQAFTILLERDDQPITEGTPYSKAAVLPDELAAIICPNTEDPTPADALGSLLPRNGGAPMTGNLAMGGNKIRGLGAPVDNLDAVTKEYADGAFRWDWLYSSGSSGLGHGERSITLETMSDYTWLMIVWRGQKDSAYYHRSFLPVVKNNSLGTNQRLRMETVLDGGYYRDITITDTGVTTTTATKADGSTTSTAYCTLMQVWGCKF